MVPASTIVTQLSHGRSLNVTGCSYSVAVNILKTAMKTTILVVDDEADALELISYNLKQVGYNVVTSTTGADALSKAKTLLPSLILLDVMLPEVDGFDICKTLRRETS